MKKGLIIIFILQGLAFLVITYYKYMPGFNIDQTKTTDASANKKFDVLDFWQYYNKASDYRIAGDYTEALKYYELALKIDSTHQNSLYYTGSMHMIMGNFKAAQKSWTRLVKVNSSSARGHSQLGTLYSYNNKNNTLYNLHKSCAHFKKATQLNQEETGPLLELAKIDLLNNQMDSATYKLKDVVSSNFRSVEAIFLQGYLCWKKGELKEAEALLNKSVSIEQGTNTKLVNVGEGETESGDNPHTSDASQARLFSDLIDQLLNNIPTTTRSQTIEVYRQFEEHAKIQS